MGEEEEEEEEEVWLCVVNRMDGVSAGGANEVINLLRLLSLSLSLNPGTGAVQYPPSFKTGSGKAIAEETPSKIQFR